jgi:recombination protein RecT
VSIREAVEKVDEVRGNAPAVVTPAQMVRQAIEQQSDAFRAVLPAHVDPDRFSRLVLSAVKSTPDLMRCFETSQGKTSVLLAAMQAAALGIEPNTPTQDGWLLPRKNKGVWEAQLSIGYRGLMKLARRSGAIKTMYAEVVRERDSFRWARGLEEDVLEHVPYDGPEDPGELTHAYAVARFVSGGYSFIVLNRRQIEQRRDMSDSWKNTNARPYSPWSKWPEAMWRKSAIRALMPFLDLSPDAERAVHSDEQPLALSDEGVIEAVSVPFDPPAERPELAPVPEAAPEISDAEAAELAGDPFAGLPDETGAPQAAGGFYPEDPPQVDTGEAMTDAQSKALHALMRSVYNATGPARFTILTDLLGREITTTKDLTKAEASRLIDEMQSVGEGATA